VNDLLVAGAGPAGLATAIHAARAIIKADMNLCIEADIARANEILSGPPPAPTF
jgi:thioredoxin reductase